jgi:hypothetical protein
MPSSAFKEGETQDQCLLFGGNMNKYRFTRDAYQEIEIFANSETEAWEKLSNWQEDAFSWRTWDSSMAVLEDVEEEYEDERRQR